MAGGNAIVPAAAEDHELTERRRLLARFVAMGVIAWTVFALLKPGPLRTAISFLGLIG